MTITMLMCRAIEELGFVLNSSSSAYKSPNIEEDILELKYGGESYVCDSIEIKINKESSDFIFSYHGHEWLSLSSSVIQKIGFEYDIEELQVKIYTDINDVITILLF